VGYEEFVIWTEICLKIGEQVKWLTISKL
jgi:hypothetical protein